jgi:hypothetical protein
LPWKRNRINADLGINVPLDKFMQGASVATWLRTLRERMLTAIAAIALPPTVGPLS